MISSGMRHLTRAAREDRGMEPEEQVTVSGSPMADRRAVIRNTI